MIQIETEHGVPFNVRIIFQGEAYASRFHTDPDPLVEFYDARYRHCFRGQFVARYYLSTLLEGDSDLGLCLDGSTPEWRIDGPAYNKVLDYCCAAFNFNKWETQ